MFGTVLFGRMNAEGAERALGLYLNTLPIRIEVDARSVEAGVRDTQAALAELMRHEHASLASAQRCSGVASPAPLFTTLLNYRYIAPSAASRSGIERLGGRERTNYPLSIAINDHGEALSLGMGKVAQPLRVAITGTQVSPDISHTVYLAGREEALKRIDAAIARVG